VTADPTNSQIADALDELGDLYELDGAVQHRVLAYRNGARAVRDCSRSVARLAREQRATELPGIGATLQEKILALVQTGEIPAAAKLRERWPAGVLEVTRLPGIGAKRARLFFTELGVAGLDDLRAAAEGERLRTLKGVGPKMEASVLEALERRGEASEEPARLLAPRALEIAEEIVTALEAQLGGELDVLPAGSVRRGAETSGDLDLIATGPDPRAIVAAFRDLELFARVESGGEAGARAITHSGVAVDLRVGEPERHGNLLQHFTGSAAHNTALREQAVKEGLHVSEYGIEDESGGEPRLCAGEAEVYRRLGMSYIPPELRENRGELEAAREGRLPALIEPDELRGDLHMHTVASDGRATIEEMALAARELGHEYIAITDHSASHGFGDDVSEDELRRQIERVREADSAIEEITILAGSEVNILADGSPDYDDAILGELDWVIASVHTAFQIDEAAMTARIVAAIEHPLIDAIGHPTGRLIGRRDPYAVDREALYEAAARTGTALEINASPERRDLSEVDARAAAGAGVKLVINSDAHRPQTLTNLRWGIATARRAWLTAADVLNTLTLAELRAARPRGL